MPCHIIHGDARQTGLPDAHFHCVATSPPYFGLREYGDDDREIGDEPTPDEYIDELRKVGREVWRVLRDDGVWFLNLGDSFVGAQRGRACGKTGTTQSSSPARGCLCGSLCDACRKAYLIGTSHNDHPHESRLDALRTASNPDHRDQLPDHQSISGCCRLIGHTLHAKQDPEHSGSRAHAPPHASQPSTNHEYDPRLQDAYSQTANRDECQLCGHSLVSDDRPSEHTAVCICDICGCASERHSQDKDVSVSAYQHSTTTSVPSKSLLMIPQRVALALQADGWIIRAQIPWVKASCMPESVRDRPTVAHEYVFLLAKSQRYFWDADAVRMPHGGHVRRFDGRPPPDGTGGAMRNATGATNHNHRCGNSEGGRNLRTSDFFHTGLDEYAAHLAHVRENGGLMLSPDGDPLAFMVNPVGNKLAHFAMWPPRLVAPMIKASTSEKGCCPKCGAQWRRIVEKTAATPARVGDWKRTANNDAVLRNDVTRKGGFYDATSRTLGFSPSCECNAGDPVPCRVLDPFAGSGTTMQVAESLGRDSWGVELMAKNIPIIGERLKEKLDSELMKPIKVKPRPSRVQSLTDIHAQMMANVLPAAAE